MKKIYVDRSLQKLQILWFYDSGAAAIMITGPRLLHNDRERAESQGSPGDLETVLRNRLTDIEHVRKDSLPLP